MTTYTHPVKTDPIFRRIIPHYNFDGGLTVFWEFKPTANIKEPFTCQIEINPEYNDPQAWTAIGDPVVNQLYAEATLPPLTGKLIKTGVRIHITDANNLDTYSFVQTIMGNLSYRQWNYVKVIQRRYNLHARNLIAFPGVLLKRKLFGPDCRCRDPITREITDTYCTLCYGTGIAGGYWKAWNGRLIDLSPRVEVTRRDPHLLRGPTDAQLVTAMLVSPVPVTTEDVWVRTDVDLRYNIRQVRNRAEIVHYAAAVLLEMGPFEFSSVIYEFPI